MLRIAGAISFGVLAAFVGLNLVRNGPKGGRKQTEAKQKRKETLRAVTRDTFKASKVPEHVDYVVIGSGIASLYCAALLSKAGFVVVVLEQHYVAGGCLHSFEEKGFEFDTGIHYVGKMQKYKAMIDAVCSREKVEWIQMGSEADGFVYDQIKLGEDEPFKFRSGEDNLKADLIAAFPEEQEAIEKYFAILKEVNESTSIVFGSKIFHPWIEAFLLKFGAAKFHKWAGRTTESVLSELTSNQRLKSILCGQFGDYGLTPEESSIISHAATTAHYFWGGFYPKGGSQKIADSLAHTIVDCGGAVLVRASVSEILVDEKSGRATGVRVGDTTVTASKGVVSGIGLRGTHKLVPEAHRNRLGWQEALGSVQDGVSHVTLSLGIRGSSEELGLPSSNLWHLPVDSAYHYKGVGLNRLEPAANAEDPWSGVKGKDLLMFVVFPSAKDPTFSQRFPGKSTCEVITQCPGEWFSRFLDATNPSRNVSGKRKNPAYDKLKDSIRDKMMERLYELYPQLEGRVEYAEVGTPLTNLFYLGREASYGLEHTPDRYVNTLAVRPKTNIPGLYFTGQDFISSGFAGGLFSGMLTANAITGYGFLDFALFKRNLLEDIMNWK